MRKRILSIGLFLGCLALAPRAHAGPSPADAAAGMALFNEGRALASQGKCAEALEKFSAANALEPSPGIWLNIGDCAEKLGRLATAYGAYSEAATLARRIRDDRAAEAERRGKLLEPRLSRLKLDVAAANRGAGVVIEQDGRAIPEPVWASAIPVDSGEHTLKASAPGKKPWTATVRIEAAPGTTPLVVPALEPDPSGGATPAAPFWTSQRTAGAAVTGAGLAGIIAGSVLGALTLKKISDSKSQGHCNATLTVCDAPGLQMQADAKATAHGSTAALAVGGAAVVTGVVLLATGGGAAAPKSAVRVTVSPVAGVAMSGVLLRGGW